MRFVSWTGTGIADPESASTTVLIDSAKTVTANFAAIDDFADWAAGHGLEGEDADPEADPDNDGIDNWTEKHLGLLPGDSSSRLEMHLESSENNGLALRINRVVSAGTFVLRSGPAPGQWDVFETLEIPADGHDHEIKLPRAAARRFYQLVYTPPPRG